MNLFQYIKGNRKGKEINRLEKEAMNDPFLADALDGFDRVKNTDHELRIKEMRMKILSKTKSGSSRIVRYISIAAGILLIFGSGWYFLLKEESKVSSFVPEKQIVENKESMPDDTLQEVFSSEMKTQPENATEKEVQPAITAKTRRNETDNKTQTETVTFHEEAFVMEESTPPVEKEDSDAISDMKSIDKKDSEIITAEEKRGKVRGIITDTNGNPLPGAAVIYCGTNTGTVSDTAGYFELPESDEKNIQVNYIGYEPANLVVEADGILTVTMKESAAVLSEVTVVAFGLQKKESTIASISPVENNALKSKPVSSKKEYNKYLKENIIMPQSEQCKGKKGKVRLKFTIDPNGRPTNIRIMKSLCPEADKEAIRLVEQGPDWTISNKEIEIKVKFE